MKIIFYSLVTFLSILCFGCGSIVTSKRSSLPKNGKSLQGVFYYLPKGALHIDGTWNKDAQEWVVKTSTSIEPDPKCSYYLKRKVNWLFEDNVVLAIDQNGLLQTVNATSEDKTVSGLADLISAAGAALKFGAGVAGGMASLDVKLEESRATTFHVTVYPGEEKITIPIQKVATPDTNKSLAEFEITIERACKNEEQGQGAAPKGKSDGIVVRALVPYSVKVSATVHPNGSSLSLGTNEQIVVLPDSAHNYVIPLDRMPLVKNDTKIALASGVVQKLEVTRPSIVAGIIGIPKTLLSMLASTPLEIKQYQANYSKAIDDKLKTDADIKKQ